MLLLSFLSFLLLNFGVIFAALIGCGGKKGAAGNGPGEASTDNKTNEPVKTKTDANSAVNQGTTPFKEDPDLKSRSNYNVKSDGSTVPGNSATPAPA
uniref:Uncharacterized protein n=1 Tax=Panagrolaimus sp. ES5 TaxID=591445 RepID=A0AC34FM76_9BILA